MKSENDNLKIKIICSRLDNNREFLTKEIANYLTLKDINYKARVSLTTVVRL